MMTAVKNIGLGIFHGLWDSIRGMTLLLYIDAEIHRQNAAKEAERQQRLQARQARAPRTPSPTPSSASAMAREELREQQAAAKRENPDERSLESLLKKPQPKEEVIPKGEKKIAKQVLKCCLLNGGFTWLSIVFFEQLLMPALRFTLALFYGESSDLQLVWGWIQPMLSILFGMMWVLPIFVVSKVVSSLWFADIANAAYRVRKGRPQMIPSISKLVADFLFSLVVQALFLVQSMIVDVLPIPYVGKLLCFLHLCLLYSLYSFEYKWFNMGWELHRRLSYIENNWPYFLGFGIPLTVLTNMSSSVIVSSCIFSIFFPLFILSGNEAKPVVKTTETPLRLFSPVIFTSNLFFNRSGRATRPTAAQVAQHKALKEQQMQREREQELRIKQQIHEYHMQRQRSLQREREAQQQQQEFQRRRSSQSTHSSHSSSPFRYPQPPSQRQEQPQPSGPRSISPDDIFSGRYSPVRSSNMRGRFMGGLAPPLIPTPVPGAPTSAVSSTATSGRRHR